MLYLSALEVCSQRGAIQIHVYLYLYLNLQYQGDASGLDPLPSLLITSIVTCRKYIFYAGCIVAVKLQYKIKSCIVGSCIAEDSTIYPAFFTTIST